MRPNLALLVVDVQQEFARQDASGETRSTPQAESMIAQLLANFRERGLPVIHVHHHSEVPGSGFAADSPGSAVQEFAVPTPGEPVYIKHENSAFIRTSLEEDLRAREIETLVICGATANHCVETTTRMAGNLGFDAKYIRDAVWAYGNTGPDGRYHEPEDVLSMTISNLHGEFAEVLTTNELLARLEELTIA